MSDLAGLAASLRKMLGPGIGVGAADPKKPGGRLWPEEEAAMARAIPRRVLEFTAGRVAARAAMADIGLDPHPIPMARDRAPVWPTGLVGSIAHCHSACIAAVAPCDQFRALGIDIEVATPLDPDLWETILTPGEQNWLDTRPKGQRGPLAKAIFSAKESIFKAQYPLTLNLIGFDAVEVSLSHKSQSFSGTFLGHPSPFPDQPPPVGYWTVSEQTILSSIILPC